MSADSKIEWTTHTFNPWWGCAKVSAGCKHCYAETLSSRFDKDRGLWGVDAHRRPMSDVYWQQPLKWDRAAQKAGERHRVFCASMADVLEDREDLDAHRDRLFSMITATPQLDWQLLTKRPGSIMRILRRVGIASDSVDVARMCAAWCGGEAPRNVWLGVSVEDQASADERIPLLLGTPAALRFLSVEPLLGPVDLSGVSWGNGDFCSPLRTDSYRGSLDSPAIGWVIVGGESGPGARPCNVEWISDVVEQCKQASVPCFVKQLGAAPTGNRAARGASDVGNQIVPLRYADRKGGDIAEWPIELRVRQFPEVQR